MSLSTAHDVGEYYDQTQTHYEIWWKLKKARSMHYGIWEKDTKSFVEALQNTDQVLLEKSQISETDKVLDAGCGVGGTAIFIAKKRNAQVTGITLSDKQLEKAIRNAQDNNVNNLVKFYKQDFTGTSFPDSSFTIIWACESVSHVKNINGFCEEAARMTTDKGRLILSDFFLTEDNQTDPNSWIKKWENSWAITKLFTVNQLAAGLENHGFKKLEIVDVTDKIEKSVYRLYLAYQLGKIPSKIYNALFNVSPYAKYHYRSGYYQYKAFKQGLWRYKVLYANK